LEGALPDVDPNGIVGDCFLICFELNICISSGGVREGGEEDGIEACGGVLEMESIWAFM